MVPEGWNKVKTSNILEKVALPVNVLLTEEYKEIGIRSHGKGIFYKEKVLGRSLGNKRVFYIEPNCLVLNIVFAWEQAVAKTTANEVGMIASHRFPMYRPKNNLCDINFILYLFKTKLGKNLLELASPGGAGRNKTLGQSEFARLEIIIPPLPEQKKIAEILSTWDKAITTSEKLLANSEQQKKALMRQLLTGKKRFSGFEGEWRKVYLSNIASIFKGKALSSKDLQPGNYSVIAGGKTSPYKHSDYTHEKVITVSASGAYAGFVSFHNSKIWASDCSVIKAKKNTDIQFIYQFLILNQKKIYLLQSGGAQPHIYPKDLEVLKINVPVQKEQEEITSILSIADKKNENLQKKLNYLKQEKKALMQQLLTGKRRIKV